MAKGKQNATTSKRKRVDKDSEQSAVVSKRPVLHPSTGMKIPSGQTPSLSGREDRDDSLTPERCTSQQEAFERLKRLNEELMKFNEQLKQDKLSSKKEQNRAQGRCASTELRDIHAKLGYIPPDEIHHLKNVVAIARQTEAWVPIRSPIITKEGSVDFRLTSTQELLGLQLDGEDFDGPNQVNARGFLKEQCWKYLLTISRDTIPWAFLGNNLESNWDPSRLASH
ncbi:hypothetical protein QFC24_003678 [Naganishia onofrii]|uniref:Uncharacterized protein n=1 Tax=Naganishia onofrii TaxID=1851511 RepID=A0ACC2XJ92_9TREE|nr:hypothetical protein QFC24_003678 [Naganishia onofrii]